MEAGASAQGSAGLGFALERQGKLAEALEYLTTAKQAAPEDLRIRLALGRIHVIRGEVKAARPELTYVVDHRSDALPPLLLLAAIADRADAVALAARLRRANSAAQGAGKPASLESLVARADLATLQGDTRTAESLFAQVPSAQVGGVELATTLADVYARRRRFEPAEALLTAAARASDDPGTLWLKLARVALENGRLASAEEALAEATAKAERDAEIPWLRARVALARGQHATAAQLIEQALARLPHGDRRRSDWVVANAKALVESGDQDQAVALLGTEIKRAPGNLKARLALGALQLERRAVPQAIETLEPFRLDPEAPPEAIKLLAAAYVAADKPDQALAAIQAYVQHHSKQPAGYVMLGSLLADRGSREGAKEQYQQALTHDAESMAALRGLAELEALGDQGVDGAARLVREHAKSAKRPWLHYELLGDLWLGWKHPADAASAYDESLGLRPNRPALWLKLARLDIELKDRASALRAAQEAVKHSGRRDLVALLMLAQLARDDNRIDVARESYESMLVLDPTSVVALNNLAMLYAGPLSSPGKGVEYAERAYQQASELGAVADTLGWLLYLRNRAADLPRAVQLLEKAAEKLDTATIHYHLGMAQLRAEQTDAGRGNLRRALRLSSDFDGAREARDALASVR